MLLSLLQIFSGHPSIGVVSRYMFIIVLPVELLENARALRNRVHHLVKCVGGQHGANILNVEEKLEPLGHRCPDFLEAEGLAVVADSGEESVFPAPGIVDEPVVGKVDDVEEEEGYKQELQLMPLLDQNRVVLQPALRRVHRHKRHDIKEPHGHHKHRLPHWENILLLLETEPCPDPFDRD